IVKRAHSHLFRPVAAPPQRHQVEIDWSCSAPDAGVRMIRQRINASRLDSEFFHLDTLALRVTGERAHIIDQMPRIWAVSPIAHRHRASRNAGDDMTIETIGSALPLKTPAVRSRGRVGNPSSSFCSWAPSPLAVSPWHEAQASLYSSRARAFAAASKGGALGTSIIPSPPLPSAAGIFWALISIGFSARDLM